MQRGVQKSSSPIPTTTPRGALELGRVDGKPINLSARDRSVHLLMIGASKTGKTTAMESLVRQDIDAGRGLCLIDPMGALYERLLSYCCYRRGIGCKVPDVVLFNPSQGEWVLPYNPFVNRGGDISVQVDRRVQATLRAWGQQSGDETPRLEKWLKCLYTVLIECKLTIMEAGYLLDQHSEGVRSFLTQGLTDVFIRSKLEQLSSYKTSDFMNQVESVENRLMRFLSSTTIRRTMGSSQNALDFRQIMDEGKIVLVNLQPSEWLSTEQQRLFGTLLLTEFFEASLQRPTGAKPFYLYVDEAARFVTSEMGEAFEQCRQKGLHMTLAFQHLSQFKTEDVRVYKAIKNNARNKLVFAVPDREDATELADDVFVGLTEPELKVMHKKLSHLILDVRDTSQTRAVGTSQSSSVNESSAHSVGFTHGSSEGISDGVTHGQSEGGSEGLTRGTSETESRGISRGRSHGESRGTSHGGSIGLSHTLTRSSAEGRSNSMAFSRGRSLQTTVGQSSSSSSGESHSKSESETLSSQESRTASTSTTAHQSSRMLGTTGFGPRDLTRGSGYSSGQGRSETASDGDTYSETTTHGESRNKTSGRNTSLSFSRTKQHSESEGFSAGRTAQASESQSTERSRQLSDSRSLSRSSQVNSSTSLTQSHQQNVSESASRSVQASISRSDSQSFSAGRGQQSGDSRSFSVTEQPGTRHIPFLEDTPEYWTLEEQRWRAAELIMRQPTGQWFASTENGRGTGSTPIPRKTYLPPEIMLGLRRGMYAEHCLEPSAVDALVSERQQRLLAASNTLPREGGLGSAKPSVDPGNAVASPSAQPIWNRSPSPFSRRPGPKADIENHAKVAGIILAYGSEWISEDNLLEICAALDSQQIPPPKTWISRREGAARSWRRGLQLYSQLVVRAIKDRLDALEHASKSTTA